MDLFTAQGVLVIIVVNWIIKAGCTVQVFGRLAGIILRVFSSQFGGSLLPVFGYRILHVQH
jgi:hypothetical protein